jgi:hypothetical protein
MKKVYVHECGGDLSNITSQISISEPIDFALVVGNKSYRMQTDREDNLMISLINGVDVKFTISSGYPTIKLTQSSNVSDDWYDYLKNYGR